MNPTWIYRPTDRNATATDHDRCRAVVMHRTTPTQCAFPVAVQGSLRDSNDIVGLCCEHANGSNVAVLSC